MHAKPQTVWHTCGSAAGFEGLRFVETIRCVLLDRLFNFVDDLVFSKALLTRRNLRETVCCLPAHTLECADGLLNGRFADGRSGDELIRFSSVFSFLINGAMSDRSTVDDRVCTCGRFIS